jgi:uncharacterized protein (TIGR03437 family)
MKSSRIRWAALVFALPVVFKPCFASDADAIYISQRIQERHLPYGTIIDPMYASASSNAISDYTRCGDSAIWTGHYLAAEAFRYQVTGDPVALTNVQGAIAGIESLVNVTGTSLLARCIWPTTSPYAASLASQESANGIYTNTAMGDQWEGNTSRDQYSGVFFGLAVAYDVVNDAGVQSSISALITQMLDFLRNNAWTIVMPDGGISDTFIGQSDQQLSFMYVGLHVNPQHYQGDPEFTNPLLTYTVAAPIAYDTLSNSSYFKFNLDEINLYDLVRLDSSSNQPMDVDAYNVLWNYVGDQQNAFFNMITRALQGADAARDSNTTTMLNQWLTRPIRDPYVDLEGQYPTCGSASEACSPVPVPLRPTTDFLWQRDPYMLEGGGQGTIEGAGIDYILPYWMARYYGLGSSAAVVNAAASSTTVAPDSIASFYAPSLGTSVTVTDNAGQARAATLFFVSSTQINFGIPGGTALGQAVVTSTDSSGNVLATSTAEVATVAPGIFAATFLADTQGNEYLVLYANGVRGEPNIANVQVTINGTNLTVLYAGAQGTFTDLDQVNAVIPASLSGAQGAQIVLTVDGQQSTAVTANIP